MQEQIKEKARRYIKVLNDLSADYENYVNDDYQQGLLRRLDEVIDWLYDLQKEQ